MNMDNAIKRAIEGGWKPKSTPTGLYHFQSFDGYLIDPKFWKALGKAEGWHTKMNCGACDPYEGTVCHRVNIEDWKGNMHNFIDHLIAEKPIDEFFNNLLK